MAMAVTGDGRIFVTDVAGARMNVYDADGETLESWSLGSPMAALGLVLTTEGDLYTRILEIPDDADRTSFSSARLGMQEVGPDGLEGEPVFPPPTDYEAPVVTIEAGGNSLDMGIIPFTPSHEWAFAPGGETIAGVGDEYRFEIHHPDGRITVVEKRWDPVPVQDEEADFHARRASAGVGAFAPDYRMDPSAVPAHKPAFTGFSPDRSGRVWVRRQGPGHPDPDCTELDGGSSIAVSMSTSGESNVVVGTGASGGDDDELEEDCWADALLFDVCDVASGEFLGTVPAPEPGFQSLLFVEGDTVLASVLDTMGTARLKKYRLETGS